MKNLDEFHAVNLFPFAKTRNEPQMKIRREFYVISSNEFFVIINTRKICINGKLVFLRSTERYGHIIR